MISTILRLLTFFIICSFFKQTPNYPTRYYKNVTKNCYVKNYSIPF